MLGDRYGRKKILVIGLVLFGLASALSAFATDPMQLIIARGLMGIGGASVLPVTLAIITVVFPPHEEVRRSGWAASVRVRWRSGTLRRFRWSTSGGARCS